MKRINGCIFHIVKSNYFVSADEMIQALDNHRVLYNQHIEQGNLALFVLMWESITRFIASPNGYLCYAAKQLAGMTDDPELVRNAFVLGHLADNQVDFRYARFITH